MLLFSLSLSLSRPVFNSFYLFFLFVLFSFIYNIYRTTYLRQIIFPCTAHNERSFFIFQYLTNYLSLKFRTNENNERQGALLWTGRAETFCLRTHRDPFTFFIALSRLSDQNINDISSTTWTKQKKKHFYWEKYRGQTPYVYTVYVCVCVCVCVCVRVCVCVCVRERERERESICSSPNVEPKPIDRSRSESIYGVLSQSSKNWT